MPPQQPLPTQTPPTEVQGGQINPLIQRILQQRAQQNMQGAPGAGTAPNTIPNGGAVVPPGVAPPRAMSPMPGGTNPASAVMKAAGQAQSPLVADGGTRALAKALIQKLMQHM